MRLIAFLSIALFISVSAIAQSDLLILKKNNRTEKTFFPGSEINFYTATGFYKAYVTSIERDSVFVIQYDIRQVPTNLGVYVLDTVGRYPFAVNYHDITGFEKYSNKFDWKASGGALLGGGVLLTTVGLGTWLFAKPDTRYYARPSLVIGSAVLAGIGYLMLRPHHNGMQLGKKYKLNYIKVK